MVAGRADRNISKGPGLYVTDMRHFDGIEQMTDKASSPARKLAMYMGAIVGAASAGGAGRVLATPLPCQRRPDRRPCPGTLLVRRTEVPPTIVWVCPSCGDEGVISGWEETIWNLGPAYEPSAPVEVRLDWDRYRALAAVMTFDADVERIVRSAEVDGDAVVLRADAEDLDLLIGAVTAESNNETSAKRRRALDEVSQMVEEAISGQ